MKRKIIKMPRLGNNDDFVTLECWCVKNGDYVTEGQIIAILESTKETQDLVAEIDGFISFTICEGTEVAVGGIIAEICNESPIKLYSSNEIESVEVEGPATDFKYSNISKKAKKLIEKYDIDISTLPDDRIIKEKDILELVDKTNIQKQSKANEILIICGGNIARMCIDTLRLMGGYRFGGITDKYAKQGTSLMGVPYIGDINVLETKYIEGYRTAVNAYGGLVSSNRDELFFARQKIFNKIKEHQFFLPNLIHPSANVEISASMGEGNLIFSGAYIGSESVIGNDCIINTGAIVSHGCVIEDHCRISPGAILAGDVSIGQNTIVGMGVTIYMKVTIGKNVIIYNGQHIFNDIPDNAIVK